MKKNLLIISDGHGVDVKFKKWPFFLKLLVSKTHNVINKSVIGASNEMIWMRLIEAVREQQIDQAIIQWTWPIRVDVLADKFWSEQAAQDPIYHFNIVKAQGRDWWVTSASENAHIKEYHQLYVDPWQAALRSESYMMAAAELLCQHNVDFVFSLCCAFNRTGILDEEILSYPWVWHQEFKGLHEFRQQSKYLKHDQGFAQPHPLIGLEWIDAVLNPQCDFIDYNQKTFYNIEQTLLKQCSE